MDSQRLIQLSIICLIFNTENELFSIKKKGNWVVKLIKLTLFFVYVNGMMINTITTTTNSIIHCISCFRLLSHLNYYDPIHMFPPTTIPMTIPWGTTTIYHGKTTDWISFRFFIFFNHFCLHQICILTAKVFFISFTFMNFYSD